MIKRDRLRAVWLYRYIPGGTDWRFDFEKPHQDNGDYEKVRYVPAAEVARLRKAIKEFIAKWDAEMPSSRHHADALVRKDGKDKWYQIDWLWSDAIPRLRKAVTNRRKS